MIAEFISHDKAHASSSTNVEAFAKEWGIDMSNEARGGVLGLISLVYACICLVSGVCVYVSIRLMYAVDEFVGRVDQGRSVCERDRCRDGYRVW